MDNTLNANLARLRSQAHLIRTSIEALIGQARFQAVLRWEEVLFQFNTLQRQMDDLRDEIVALPILSYFLLAPKDMPLIIDLAEEGDLPLSSLHHLIRCLTRSMWQQQHQHQRQF